MNRTRTAIALLALLITQAARPAVSRALAANEVPAIPAPQTPSPSETGPAAGTLAYHLATNAAGHARGRPGSPDDLRPLAGWSYDDFTAAHLYHLTNSAWSASFWLQGVRGLSATSIGYINGTGGQGMVTMVSPRHYLFAAHMHPESYRAAFLDTNNVIHWRTTLQRAEAAGDTAVGLLNEDLPPSVGFLPVPPADYRVYLPTNNPVFVQGVGMNQDMRLFSQPMNFSFPGGVDWNSRALIPLGLGTNWSIAIRAGDSSDPEMLLIGNQLVLVSHNAAAGGGPDYASQINVINQTMHRLSTENHLRTDYQLTLCPLTNWPVVNH